jgi:hypothetical protein
MIPHAALPLASAVGALVVAVIGASLVAGPVPSARLAGCPRPATVAACLAAVDVATVAPAVYPELAAAVPAMSQSDFQWASARPKNWTPSPSGRILLHEIHAVRRTRAAHEGSER